MEGGLSSIRLYMIKMGHMQYFMSMIVIEMWHTCVCQYFMSMIIETYQVLLRMITETY